jgi:hypothetical protein
MDRIGQDIGSPRSSRFNSPRVHFCKSFLNVHWDCVAGRAPSGDTALPVLTLMLRDED